MRMLAVVRRNAVVYRRVWRGSIFSSFVQPALFLTAMGIGVGSLVDRREAMLPHGMSFLEFVASGVLAATCMQLASFESSWPVLGKLRWRRNYEAIVAAPVRVADLVIGELTWIALRLTTTAAGFALVMAAFGLIRTPMRIPLLVAAGVLTGLAFSAAVLAYAATLKSGNTFNVLFRFGITPLFLFSGVFFPITRLPESLQVLAWATPLFHGVELVRGVALGMPDSTQWIVHVAYLAAMGGAGLLLAQRTFRRALHP